MAKTDRLADFLASESKDTSCVTMDELLVKAEDMTLADHDKIHHPEGWKEGDECKLRDDFKAANAGEEIGVGENSESSHGYEGGNNPFSGNSINKSSDLEYVETDPKTFYEEFQKTCKNRAIEKPEGAWRVSKDYSAQDYEHTVALLQTKEGDCAAIKQNGDIVSVCVSTNPKRDGIGSKLLGDAVMNGGNRLDAYSGIFSFYTKQGFEPVSWCEWNDEFAPNDWKPEYGREPIVFFKYTGEKKNIRFEEWKKSVEVSKDYDDAQRVRDIAIDEKNQTHA